MGKLNSLKLLVLGEDRVAAEAGERNVRSIKVLSTQKVVDQEA